MPIDLSSMKTSKRSGSMLLTVIGTIVSVVSFIETFKGDYGNPYFTTALVLLGIVGAFTAGYCARDAVDFIWDVAGVLVERAAAKAVDSKLPELERMVDERIDSRAIPPEKLDEILSDATATDEDIDEIFDE